MVPSLAADSGLPGAILPTFATGGQMLAQAPAQLLAMPLSFSKRYTVLPWASTRTVPSAVRVVRNAGAFAVFAVVAPPPVAYGELDAPPPEPPPHPAATRAMLVSATGAAAMASRRFMIGSFRDRGGLTTMRSTTGHRGTGQVPGCGVRPFLLPCVV